MLSGWKKLISKNFVLYGCIGVSGVLIDLIIFYLLVEKLSWNYQLANWVSTSLGIINNFFLNAFVNFGKTDHLLKRFARFYMIGLLGLFITALILFVLVELFQLDSVAAKGVTIVVVFLVQYGLNKRFSFKDSF